MIVIQTSEAAKNGMVPGILSSINPSTNTVTNNVMVVNGYDIPITNDNLYVSKIPLLNFN